MPTKITYTVTEAAELLGISRSSAYECVRRGEIPSLTLGRRVVIPRRRSKCYLTRRVFRRLKTGGTRSGPHSCLPAARAGSHGR